jgi:heme-degrading monooxygenase HmoA
LCVTQSAFICGSFAFDLRRKRREINLKRFKSMYSSTFIFAPGQFDDQFHQLDQEIAAMAKALPGYLGEETWENTTTGLVSNVYYWDSLESLQKLTQLPKHLEAKANQQNWLAGYQVVISQVLRTYGDAKLNAKLPIQSTVSA